MVINSFKKRVIVEFLIEIDRGSHVFFFKTSKTGFCFFERGFSSSLTRGNFHGLPGFSFWAKKNLSEMILTVRHFGSRDRNFQPPIFFKGGL